LSRPHNPQASEPNVTDLTQSDESRRASKILARFRILGRTEEEVESEVGTEARQGKNL